MGSRLDFHDILEETIENENVYFQPPSGHEIIYPCIVYSLGDVDVRFADNRPFKHIRKYEVILIHRNPDNTIVQKLIELPMSSFERSYTVDNLHHYVFSIYY